MEEALKSGNKEQIAKATETLKSAYVTNGWIPQQFNKLKQFFGFNANPMTVEEGIKAAKTAATTSAGAAGAAGAASATGAVQTITQAGGKTYLQTLKGGGIFGPLMFFGIELLMGMGKMRTAFAKDKETGNTNYGWQQVGQTSVKALGSAVGWAAGEALGVWGATKICAALGTAIAPGVGTAIGGIIGLVGGSIGCWLAGKATKALVGQDVGDKIEAENMAKSQEGQVQLIQAAYQKAQSGKLDAQSQAALQRILQAA